MRERIVYLYTDVVLEEDSDSLLAAPLSSSQPSCHSAERFQAKPTDQMLKLL